MRPHRVFGLQKLEVEELTMIGNRGLQGNEKIKVHLKTNKLFNLVKTHQEC